MIDNLDGFFAGQPMPTQVVYEAATIAWLNGLSDPMLVGQVTLVLPPPTTASTGGLPPS